MLKYMHIVNILKILEIRFIKNFNFFIMEMFKQAKNTENRIHNEFPSSMTELQHYQHIIKLTLSVCPLISPHPTYILKQNPHIISYHFIHKLN